MQVNEWLVKTFGQHITSDTDQRVCTNKLRQLLLNHKPAALLYASLIQPMIIEEVEKQILADESDSPYIIVELPWLNDMCERSIEFIKNSSHIVSVDCPTHILQKRIAERNPNLTAEEINNFITSQLEDSDREKYVQDNFGMEYYFSRFLGVSSCSVITTETYVTACHNYITRKNEKQKN
jgi:dephospho-CoA kinase